MPLLLHNFNPVMAISWFNDSVDWLGVLFRFFRSFFLFLYFIRFIWGRICFCLWVVVLLCGVGVGM